MITEQLLRERDALPAGAPERVVLRNRAVELNLALSLRLARRYRGRGVPFEDLAQVAALALVTAVDRFDSSRENRFSSYAVPTILGSLKRHFRDTAWDMRVPRTTQELAAVVIASVAEISQALGSTPTPADIAAYLHADLADVLAAIGAHHAFRVTALSAPTLGTTSLTVSDLVGEPDARYAEVEDRLVLRPLIEALPPREKRVIKLYYYGQMSQARVAAEVGVSQMHVSRLLKRSIGLLRAEMAG